MTSYSRWFVLFLALYLRIALIQSSQTKIQSDEKGNKKENLIHSLWESLKQNLEGNKAEKVKPTTTNSKSSVDKNNNNFRYIHSQNQVGSSNRRVLLMTKVLQDHYTKLHHNQDAKDEQQSSETTMNYQSPVRWSQEFKGKECIFFSEFPGAHWSFRWCPQTMIHQGYQNHDRTLHEHYSLGTYVASEFIQNTFTAEFHSRLTKFFPKATIEIYHEGDICDEKDGQRRISAILIHDEDSPDFCPKEVTSGPGQYAISSIVEPQICTYVVHVCKIKLPKNINGHKNNHGFHKVMQAYLHQSNAQILQTSRPDRTSSLHTGLPPLPPSRVESNLKLIRNMFTHAYDSYMYHAYPASEVKPLTCKPAVFNLVKIPALTLIDSLDTLIILGNYTEFARSVERLRNLHLEMAEENGMLGSGGLFALNKNVSVFETNIRVLGGLLSAHQLAEATLSSKVLASNVWDDKKQVIIGREFKTTCNELEESDSPLFQCKNLAEETYYKYDGFLLELAQDIGDRLLPAFKTRTGIPFGTVNLKYGIPKDETTIASLAGGGTLSLEMELLSRLTGNAEYGRAAKLSVRALWMRRSQFNTFGKHICTLKGEWTEQLSGIGSNSDSFYEYLIKHYILFPEDHDFWFQLVSAYGGVHNESRMGDWYADVDLYRGLSTGAGGRRVFEALMAFYPGMQILLGELTPAARSLNSFFLVRELLGFLPERFNFASWRVDVHGGNHFLRPELLESAYFLHRATKGFQSQLPLYSNNTRGFSGWQWAADYALHTLDNLARSVCGFASLRDLSPITTGKAGLNLEDRNKEAKLVDEMPSFFLSETLKYLYLTFDEENILHSDADREWIFTTEAHPIHHADTFSDQQDKTAKLKRQAKDLIKLLETKTKGKDNTTSSTSWHLLKDEKWTVGSSLEFFVEQMVPVVDHFSGKDSIESRSSTASCITEPFLSGRHVYTELDFYNETQNGMNDAHLAFCTTGNKHSLVRSCPNFYSSEYLWVRALNGGGTDYSNTFASSVNDYIETSESHFYMLGSIDALAFLGTNAHVMEEFDESRLCPIYDEPKTSKDEAVKTPDEAKPQYKNRFNGGDLGEFEVTAFTGGSGFLVQSLKYNQDIIAKLMQEVTKDGQIETYLMLESKSNTRNPKSLEEDVFFHNPRHDRTLTMGDLFGNSHICQVEIVQRLAPLKDGQREDETDMVLAKYPCAPAFFGPTRYNRLSSTEGMTVEASVQLPKADDESGCINVKNDGDNAVIQLVHRGSCTFQEKSINQKSHAEAVIVINSEEDELFIMSGDESDKDNAVAEQDLPVTVLITGSDGNEFVNLISMYDSLNRAQVFARISLIRNGETVVEKGDQFFSVTGNKFWPVLKAENDKVQIFVRDGWGIQATQHSNPDSNSIEWQLYLLQHKSQLTPLEGKKE